MTKRGGGGGWSSTGVTFQARRGGMKMGMSCGGGGRGVAAIYRVEEVGRWPAG
jgi:hypothetical protein